MSDQKSGIGIYRACGTISNNIAGAASLDFSLLVAVPAGTVSGVVTIKQALPQQPSDIQVHVTGNVRNILGAPQFTKMVTLTGTYIQRCPPPELCIFEERFTAHMLVNDKWDGTGGFEYARTREENMKVTSHPCV